MEQESNEKNVMSMHHPSIHHPSIHAGSLLAYSGNYENHYVIEVAKEQAIVVGEVCTSPNCSQIATDPSQ
jgi:hypothetical protein